MTSTRYRSDESESPDAARVKRFPGHGDAVAIALLDATGVISWVNAAWKRFARRNGADPLRAEVGTSYLQACAAAGHDASLSRLHGFGDSAAAVRVTKALRSALAGELPVAHGVWIACVAVPPRCCELLVCSRFDDNGRCVGATVIHSAAPPEAALTDPVSPAAGGGQAELPGRPGEGAVQEPLGLAAAAGLLEVTSLLELGSLRGDNAELRGLLGRIVDLARALTGARYAALGVVGRDGEVQDLVHAGMEAGVVAGIEPLPRGRGVLGLLLDQPVPIRIDDVSTHPAAVGFPSGHPSMGSFLGVPIHLHGRVFGNLYLTDSPVGRFSEADERLVVALAVVAAVAVDNNRLRRDADRNRRWAATAADLTPRLLAADAGDPVELVLDHAMRESGAAMAVLSVAEDELTMRNRAVVGERAEELVGVGFARAASAAGAVYSSGLPVLLDPSDGRSAGVDLSSFGPAMVVPLLAAQHRLGALTIARAAGAPRFTEDDLEAAARFARFAGIAVELARARAAQERLRMFDDRDRIAADLHDHIVQDIFAVGMGLAALAETSEDAAVRDRLGAYVVTLDDTITRIRATIYQLNSHAADESFTTRLHTLVGRQSIVLGFDIGIELSGSVDSGVDPALADDIVAVVHEALSNVARHARASSVRVAVTLAGRAVVVEVTDNGCGIGVATRFSGLTNMRRRAEAHQGDMTTTTPTGGGTRVRWTAESLLAPPVAVLPAVD